MQGQWMALLRTLVLLLAIVLGAARPACAQEPAPPPAPILAASQTDYPPFAIAESDQATGLAVELLRAALRAVGREVTVRVGTRPEIRTWLQQGEVQVLPILARTPQREEVY